MNVGGAEAFKAKNRPVPGAKTTARRKKHSLSCLSPAVCLAITQKQASENFRKCIP